MARLRLIPPAGMLPLELDRCELGALRRRVKACDRVGSAVSRQKQRIRELARV